MTVLDTPKQIEMYRLLVLKRALRLESMGIKRNGRSATVIVKEILGLPKSTKREVVMAKFEEYINGL